MELFQIVALRPNAKFICWITSSFTNIKVDQSLLFYSKHFFLYRTVAIFLFIIWVSYIWLNL